jgi:hypothetical protein
MREKKIILCQGGLGDHLRFSTLPEYYDNLGYDVYLSSSNIHRNPEIYHLVWDINPYIKGFSDEIPNVGDNIPLLDSNKSLKFIQQIEANHGIFDTGNIKPKIYRNHNLIEGLSDKTIVNFQSITSTYEKNFLYEKLFQIVKENNINQESILELVINNDVNIWGNCFTVIQDPKNVETSFPKYHINNIFEHCDVINSCQNYITVLSGGSVLASAVGNRNTFVILNNHHEDTYKNNCFIFENINYVK